VRPKTFSIGFDDPTYDERRYARMVAARFGTDHREQCLQSWDRQALVGLVLDHVGQPFADSSLLPTAAVSRFAAGHVKVALSGDGGDELFSGYQRYMARTLLRWYTRLPGILRRNVEGLVRRLPEPMAHHSRSILKKAHLFLDIVKRQEAERPYVAPVFYSHLDFRQLLPDLCGRGHLPPGLPQEARADDILEMMAADALVYLPQDILVKVDRASMAYSLEARAPFLDRELVELAFSLPVDWHRHGFQGKRMLRAAFADLLPASLWKRRKQGFAVPVHEWFRGGLGNEMLEMLRDVPTPIAGTQVRRLLDEHLQRRRDHGYRLWAIYIYLLWHERKPAIGTPRG
jgi:asparagine synthase (glutamine-hydrolysing)